MSPCSNFRSFLLFLLPLVLASACAPALPNLPEGYYYLTAEMTYLRDAAAFDSNVVGQLYKGDRVEKLEPGPAGWWRVRTGRTGQVGWASGELFSPTPVRVPLFFATHTVNLRECPKSLCPSLQLLSRGDKVQKIEQNDQGWWRVLVVGSRNLGWLPAEALAEHLEKAQAKELKTPYLYVAVRCLKLFRQPPPEAEVVKVLQRNDQVEKLDQNEAGWLKVRQPASGAVGWVKAADLGAAPLGYRRWPRWKKPRPYPQKPAETAPQPEVQAEPEIM